MQTDFQLAAAITNVNWTEDERVIITQSIEQLSVSENTQEAFFTYCKHWKLAPWVCVQLERNKLLSLFSENIQHQFKTAHAIITEQNERRNKVATQIFNAFNERGIDAIVLKGNLFAHTVYHDVGYKRMNDFDILIHKEDWDKIQDVYAELEFIPLGFGWNGEKEKPAHFSHVGMSFISPDFSCIVGSQWGLKSPTTNFRVPISEAWETAVLFDFFDVAVKQLSPEFNLLHLILHMGVFKCGIRDCMDVYNLIRSTSINEKHFIDLINRSNAREKAWFTLTLSNVCSPTVASSSLTQLQPTTPGFLSRRLQKRIAVQEITGDFQHSYNDYFQDIEKVVIYFNLFPQFHKKLKFYLKILALIYFPDKATALKLSDKSHTSTPWNGFTSRLKAPYFVFAVIAQEIGWKFTVLLFIKLFVDLIVSLKNYFMPKESYFDLLKRRGIDPKAIEKTVKNIQ